MTDATGRAVTTSARLRADSVHGAQQLLDLARRCHLRIRAIPGALRRCSREGREVFLGNAELTEPCDPAERVQLAHIAADGVAESRHRSGRPLLVPGERGGEADPVER